MTWNLFGAGLPLLVAVVAIPLLVSGLGTARFGVLALAWKIVGYFSLFDLGLGRALTKLVAERIGKGELDELPDLIWTALALMAALGMLGAAVLAFSANWLVTDILNVPLELKDETLTSLYLLAGIVPIVLVGSGFRGILEAHQRFDLVNAIRIPLGIFIFLGPVAILPFSQNLASVIALLAIARIVSLGAYALFSMRMSQSFRARIECPTR